MTYVSLTHYASAANCPICGAYAKFEWYYTQVVAIRTKNTKDINNMEFGICAHCNSYTIWVDIRHNVRERDYRMIFPFSGNIPVPNDDLPDDIKLDYKEAASVVNLSPRGSVALLRLALQKLCKHLGEKGENINNDIKSLVSKGLSPTIQKALDSVRVTGNSAVHPGVLDIKDDRETAVKMFGFLNIIADVMITQPKMINEYYEFKVPEGDKIAIEKRDNKG